MKMFKLNSRLARRATATVALGLLLGAQTGMACTVANWTANSNASVPGSLVAGSPNVVARYSGLCAMETSDSTVAWVQDDSPGGIDRIRARFYVLNGLASAQSAAIYRGFSTDAGFGPLLTIRLLTDGSVRLIDNATGDFVEQSSATPWVSIEIDWSQGSGDGVISLSVNGQAAEEILNLSNTGAALQSVRLGNLSGAGGSLSFDAYESRRTTEIGRLCEGETSGDGTRTNDDVLEIFAEVSSAGTELANGQPDFTEDGEITNDDVLELFEIVANALGECP